MNSDNLSCEDCSGYWNTARKKPPCSECRKPVLETANHAFWELFQDITSQARVAGLGGFVGYDYSGLVNLLRIHQFPESEWILVLEKLRAVTAVTQKIVRMQMERSKNQKK